MSTNEITAKEMKLTLLHWFQFLNKNRKWIIISGLLFSILGFTLSFIIPKTYSARLTFVLSGNDKKMGPYSSIASQFGLSIGSTGGVFQENENVMDLFLSRNMVVRTLLCSSSDSTKLLADKFFVASSLNKDLDYDKRLINYKFTNSESTQLQDSVLTIMYKDIIKHNLTVSNPNTKSDILAIDFKSIDEDLTKTFTEKLLENVSTFYTENQTKKSQENVSILRRQVDSVRYLLNSALLGAAVSLDNNPNLNPALRKLTVPTQKRQVDVEMNKAILEELVKNLEIAEIMLRKETPLFMVIDKPVLPLEYQSITKLKGIIGGFIIGLILSVLTLSFKKYISNVTN